jgi:hypothetical protein
MTIEYDDGQVTLEQIMGKVEKAAFAHCFYGRKNNRQK